MHALKTKAMNKKLILLFFTALGLVSVKLKAQEQPNPILVAAPMLSIAPDARAGGMGDAGVATAPDVYSQHWNVSKYAFHTRGAGVAMSYNPWLRKLTNDMALMNVVGFWKPGEEDNQAISASLTYLKIGDVTTMLPNIAPVTSKPYEMAVDLGYSIKVSSATSLGVALRYIRLDYSGFDNGETSASAANIIAADISAYTEKYISLGGTESLLTFGANISNLTGAKVSMDGGDTDAFIPTNLRIGTSLMYPVTDISTFSFSFDINKLLVPSRPTQKDKESSEDFLERYKKYKDTGAVSGIFKSFGEGSFSEKMKELMFSFGAEYDYDSQFKLRAGYFYENKYIGNRQYFAFGAGFKWNMLQLDAAYMVSTVSNNPLDQTLRLSLAFDIPVKNRYYKK